MDDKDEPRVDRVIEDGNTGRYGSDITSRMEESRLQNKTMQWKSTLMRQRGRPKMRWVGIRRRTKKVRGINDRKSSRS